MTSSLPLYVVQVGAVSLLIAALFFVGPALAAQAAKRPLLGAVENSLGSVPTYGVRCSCVPFLLVWTAKMIASTELWPLHVIQRRQVSLLESGAIAVVVVLFLA